MSDVMAFLSSLNMPEEAPALSLTQTAHPSPVTLRGEIVAKSTDWLTLEIGTVQYEIRLDDIVSVKEDSSKPSPDQQRGISVIIELQPTATLVERKGVRAGMLAGQVGLRPLVFTLPSKAENYAVPVVPPTPFSSFHCHDKPQTTCTPETTGNTIDMCADSMADNNYDCHVND